MYSKENSLYDEINSIKSNIPYDDIFGYSNIFDFEGPNIDEDKINGFTLKDDDIFNSQTQKNLPDISKEEKKKEKVNIINSKINTNYTTKNKIFTIDKIPKNSEKLRDKKKLGRKTKKESNSNSSGTHTKYKEDNMTRKFKSKILESTRIIMNNSLKEENYKMSKRKNLKYEYSKYFLLKLNSSISNEIGTEYNIKLLNSKLKDIFSNPIYSKCKSLPNNYNKKYIDNLYLENIKTNTKDILEKTFLECLEHYRGSKYYPELKGLELEYKNFFNEMEEKGEEKEYINKMRVFIDNFENYYLNKKSRKRNPIQK